MTSLNSTCYVTLTCSVEKEEGNVTYSWSPLGETGNVIRISRTPDSQELTYTCTAQNPISNSSDSISAQQLCAGDRRRLAPLKSTRPTWKSGLNWALFPCFPGGCPSLRPGLVRRGISSQEGLEKRPELSEIGRVFAVF